MRNIKFRGKRICDGLWLYGNLIQSNVGNVTINGTNKYCRVDPKTVGQYTGFHDKNGKEIYEGDILDVGKSGEVVKWSVHDASFVSQDPKTHFNDFFSDLEFTAIEVIGNIYETSLEELK